MDRLSVVNAVRKKFPGAVLGESGAGDQPMITLAGDKFLQVMTGLHDDSDFAYDMLIDILGIDRLPRTPRFDVVYILVSTRDFHRLRIKCRADDGQAVPSVSGIWASANWAEREVYDLMGISFSGHPDLRRILTWKNFDGHPLRKDFPLQGKDFDKPFNPDTIEDY